MKNQMKNEKVFRVSPSKFRGWRAERNDRAGELDFLCRTVTNIRPSVK